MRDVLLCSALFGGALFAMWLPLGLVWAEGAAIAALVSVPTTAFVAAAYAPRFAATVRATPARRRGEKAGRPGGRGGVVVVTIAYALSVFVLVATSLLRDPTAFELGSLLPVYVGALFVGLVVLVPALPVGALAGRFYADRVRYAQAPEPFPFARKAPAVEQVRRGRAGDRLERHRFGVEGGDVERTRHPT